MKKFVPSHGNLDHFYLVQEWTGQPTFRPPPLLSVGTPGEFRQTMREAIAIIDAVNRKKQPVTIPIEDIEP